MRLKLIQYIYLRFIPISYYLIFTFTADLMKTVSSVYVFYKLKLCTCGLIYFLDFYIVFYTLCLLLQLCVEKRQLEICDIYILAEQQLRQFIGTLLHRNGTIHPDSILPEKRRKPPKNIHIFCYFLIVFFTSINTQPASFPQIHITQQYMYKTLTYHPFHKTLPRSKPFVNWISVRFYDTGCRKKSKNK